MLLNTAQVKRFDSAPNYKVYHGAGASARESQDVDQVTIGTYNVKNLFDGIDQDPSRGTTEKPDRELRALAAVIANSKADVVALQEVENIDVLNKFLQDYMPDQFQHAVLVEGKWGFVNTTGKMQIEPKYDTVTSFVDGVSEVFLDGQFGILDSNDYFQVRDQTESKTIYSDGLAPYKKGNKWGYADRKGQIVITPAFLRAEKFSEKRAIVKKLTKIGFIDNKGKLIIPYKYVDAQPFSGGYAAVCVSTD